MTVNQHLTSFAGVPVVEFSDDGPRPAPAGEVAWAIRTEYDGEPFEAVFARFLAAVDPGEVTRLVVGYWGQGYETSSEGPLRLLVEAAPRLPKLTALFFGDIVMEEDEISWITQCDITPLLAAYPALERLDVRGGNELRLSPLASTALKVLRIESGGLPAAVVRAIGASDLPALETLELWLGVGEYGGDAAIGDLAPILGGERLPALASLGLMDSEIEDEICAAIASAPVVARLSRLSLSMGVLTDDGAQALLSGQPLGHLRELDLRHHFLSDPMVARLRAALPQVVLLIDEAEKDENPEWRYVAVSE
ncbi:MAG TPA: STM4015 family protein [Trebonia sp.]|jgi:hypothetical protein|nr:STM4015 family protein [Trebonia sp.]